MVWPQSTFVCRSCKELGAPLPSSPSSLYSFIEVSEKEQVATTNLLVQLGHDARSFHGRQTIVLANYMPLRKLADRMVSQNWKQQFPCQPTLRNSIELVLVIISSSIVCLPESRHNRASG